MDAAEPSLHDNGFYKVRHLAAIGAAAAARRAEAGSCRPRVGSQNARLDARMPSATRHTRANAPQALKVYMPDLHERAAVRRVASPLSPALRWQPPHLRPPPRARGH